jgi:uncharacterized iron-regulated membrane protein
LASFMRVLLVVGNDANDQNLLQWAPSYNAFPRNLDLLLGTLLCWRCLKEGTASRVRPNARGTEILRKTLLSLHLWSGLIAGIFLILLGVTGSFMVFEDEIDRALNPKLTWVTPTRERLAVSEMKSRLEQKYPGRTVVGFSIPPRIDMAWGAALVSGVSPEPLNVAFNQFTGEVLGTDSDRNNFVGHVHDFHLRLMMGDSGGLIVSLAAVFLLFLSLSGIVLWWPRKLLKVRWRDQATQFNFELHQALGIYLSVFLMIFSITAIVIHWENGATRLANRVTNSADLLPFPRPRPFTPDAATISFDRLLSIAEATAPGARATWIQFSGNPVRVAMKYLEDRTPSGRTNIFIDAYTGNVVYQLNSRSGPLGFRFVKLWNREIHTGDIGGLPTRIVACLLSLMLPVMAVTGPLIWWNRRRQRVGAREALRR